MKREFYKIFVKRKAWLLILVFMFLRLLTAFLQMNPFGDYRMELNRESYLRHMEVLEGKLTDEKAAYIAEENRIIRELQAHNRDAVIREYIGGEITEAEFDEQIRLRDTGNQYSDEFVVVNEQYARAQQNPERVYFVYSNGWTALLANEHFDFVLLILLMLLTVPVICNEFSSEMYPVLRTTVNGGVRLYLAKSAAAVLTAVLSAAVLFFAECVYFAVTLGLPGGSFPLQSLQPFADSPYQISIYGAAALTLLNHCFGAVFLTVLLLCLSALLRRAVSAVFLGTVSVLLPFVLFPQSEMKYLLPTPLGFLLSCGFLKSRYPVKPYAKDYLTVTPAQYVTVLCVSAAIMLILFLVGLSSFSGVRIRHKRKGRAFCILPILLLLQTGCAAQPSADAPDLTGLVYDKLRYRPETEQYLIHDDDEKGKCVVCRESGEQIPIIHDCFLDTDTVYSCSLPYIDGDTVYYLRQYSAFHDAVIALNLQDFSEQTVYEFQSSDNVEEMDMLFGLGVYLPKTHPEFDRIDSLFVHDGHLFLSRENGIFRYDLQTGTNVQISYGKSDNLAVTCGYLFYLDEVFDLYRYSPQTGCTEKLPIGKIQYFYAVENGLYCKNLKDGAFCFVSPDGCEKKSPASFHEDAFLKGEYP